MSGYQTGSDNRLTTDGLWTYTYDAEGNETQKSKGTGLETWYYGYDTWNRLTSVRQTSDGSTNLLLVTYTYDVFGDRVQEAKWKQSTGTVTTRFHYDGQDVWADTDGGNALKARYLRGDEVDQVFARTEASGQPNPGVAWYLTDRQGSVRDLMDATQALRDHLDYDGYGNATESNSAFGDRYKFTGREFDADTGLGYYRRRTYDAKQGRFESQDPIGFGAGDANLYRYVFNGPTLATDPTGLHRRPQPTPTINGQYLHQFWQPLMKAVEDKWRKLHPLDPKLGNKNRQIEDYEIDELMRAYDEAIERAKAEARAWMPDLEGQYIYGPLMAVVLSGGFGSRGRFGPPNYARQGLDELAQFRRELGPIPGGGQADGGVVSRLDVGGRSFYGINAHGQPVTLRVNAITITHAELDAFQQAANAGVRGGTGRLFVDAELCGACGKSGGVRSLARQLELTRLEIITPSGIVPVVP
jgi:RHS repeat-associated protein